MAGEGAPQGEGWWQASDGRWYPPPRPAQIPGPSVPLGPPPSVGPGDASDAGADRPFLARLFDLSMSHFITPSIIQVLFVLGIIVVSLLAFSIFIGSVNNDQPVVGLIVAVVVWFIGIVYTRVLLELVVVFFRIERNTRPPSAERVGDGS